MRPKTLLLLSAIFALTFSACKDKTYNCKCTAPFTGEKIFPITRSSKFRAIKKCDEMNTDPNDPVSDSYFDCQIVEESISQ